LDRKALPIVWHQMHMTFPIKTRKKSFPSRNRTHNKSLINKTSHLNEKDFILATNALQRH